MKSIAIVLALLVATSSAFSPLLATRAAAKPVAKKAAPKPVANKAVVAKKAAPALNLKIKAPPKPKISIQGPKTTRVPKVVAYAFDDGLTELERKQRKSLPAFLTGSAKSQADVTAIRKDLVEVADEYYFSPYDTTLATLGAFAIISLIIKAGSP